MVRCSAVSRMIFRDSVLGSRLSIHSATANCQFRRLA